MTNDFALIEIANTNRGVKHLRNPPQHVSSRKWIMLKAVPMPPRMFLNRAGKSVALTSPLGAFQVKLRASKSTSGFRQQKKSLVARHTAEQRKRHVSQAKATKIDIAKPSAH